MWQRSREESSPRGPEDEVRKGLANPIPGGLDTPLWQGGGVGARLEAWLEALLLEGQQEEVRKQTSVWRSLAVKRSEELAL